MTNIKHIIIAGCGALGSRIAIDIARLEIPMTLIDNDRVEVQNIATSIYNIRHRNMMKTAALGISLYQKCGIIVNEYQKRITSPDGTVIAGLKEANKINMEDILVVDAFDNIQAREVMSIIYPNVLHASVGLHDIGAAEWDEVYKLPDENPAEGICTHMAGRDLIVLTSAVAIRQINLFLETGKKRSAVITTEPKIIL